MPRYLGLDYLTEAFNQRRQFLNKSVLTVPQHLEYVEKYAHSGFVSDSLYRLPWKKAKSDVVFLSQEGKKAENEIKFLTNGSNSPGIEKLNSNPVNDDRSDSQFIPSSNPSSQESFPGVTVTDATEEWNSSEKNNLQYEEEVFTKLDLHSDHEDKKLEEVITKEPMYDYLLNLPSIHSLLSRLKKYNITDPLSQQQLTKSPTALFISDICFEECNNVEKQSHEDDDLFTETFEKVNPYPTSKCKDMLEETIIATELPPLIKPDSMKQLTEGLTTEAVDDQPPVSEVLDKLTGLKPAITLSVETLPRVDKKQTSFVDINGGCEFEKVILVEPLLIDPMLEAIPPQTREDNSWLAPHGHISPEQLSQEDLCFLTPKSKDLLHRAYWKQEKFFNETLALRLKEPNIPNEDLTLESSMVQMSKVVSLKKLNISIDEELDLSWDPLRTFKAQTIKPPGVESVSLLYSSGSNFPLKSLQDYGSLEKYEKYPSIILHDWSDPVLPQPIRDSGFGTLKAAIMARQKKDKFSALPSCGRRKEKKRQPAISNSSKDNYNVPVDKCEKYAEDPLSHFLMMRSAQTNSHTAEPSPIKENLPKLLDSGPSKQISSDKNKSKVVTVTFTDEYGEVAEILLEFSQPILSHLYKAGVLPEHQHLSTIPPDMTRFLLKQNQKQNTASVTTERTLLLLHVVSCVYNVYLHCSLEAAIFCLSAMEQKYQQQIEGNLTSLRSRLFQMQCLMKDKHILHPKLREILNCSEDWLRKKKRKDPDFDQKILVIVRRDINGLLTQICQTLASSSFLQPAVYSHQDKDYNTLLNRLDNVNCVIIPAQCVEESFPWSQFSLVIEHEYQPQTGWLNTCQRQNIRYLGLKVDLNRVHMENRVSKPSYEEPSPQLFMVCSQRLTTNTALLQLLESRYNCVLIERDHSKLKTDGHFADVVLDVKTGITLQNIEDLSKDCQLEELFNKLTSFHLKFSQFWLLLYTNDTNKSVLDKRKSASLSRLQRALSTFSSTAQNFSIEVMMCKDVTEVAKVICTLGESLFKTTHLSGEASQIDNSQFTADEKHLLLFPCFNALSVHVILKTHSLDQLMEMSLDDLMQTYTFLPDKVIQSFHRLKSSTAVVPLEDCDSHINRPIAPKSEAEEKHTVHRPNSSKIDLDDSGVGYKDDCHRGKGFTLESEKTLANTRTNMSRRNGITVAEQDMSGTVQPSHLSNTDIKPDSRHLNQALYIENRTYPRYNDGHINNTNVTNNRSRPHSSYTRSDFEIKAKQQYESQPAIVRENDIRPNYDIIKSQIHMIGEQLGHNSAITEVDRRQQNVQDTDDGYGDFQISDSPSLDLSEPAQDLCTYEDRKVVDEVSQLQDSEELSIPKPNEFTMAEIEGKIINHHNFNNQEVKVETRTAASDTIDQNLNLVTQSTYRYPDEDTKDDKNDQRIVHPDIHHQSRQYLSRQNVRQYGDPSMNANIPNSNRHSDVPSQDYPKSISLSRYPIGQQQSRLVSRDERSTCSTDFSHLTNSTILGPVHRPQLSKKKYNQDEENSSEVLPGLVRSANCRKFNKGQESYVEDFMNSIKMSNVTSRDNLNHTSAGQLGHACLDVRESKVYDYDSLTLQGFNHASHPGKSNSTQPRTETITNSRYTNDSPRFDGGKERFQESENLRATLRKQDQEYLESSNYSQNIHRLSNGRQSEMADRSTVKDIRLYKPGGNTTADTTIKSNYYDAKARDLQLPADSRYDRNVSAEQQNHHKLLPASLSENYQNSYRSADRLYDEQFINQPSSSEFTGYSQTRTMSDSQQHSLTSQYRGTVSSQSVQSHPPHSYTSTWSRDMRSGGGHIRNRFPPHRVSIGLAQPFPRNPQTVSEPPEILTVHADDSPPMDLDYDLEQSIAKPMTHYGSSRHNTSQLQTASGDIPGNRMNQCPQQPLVQHNGELREPEMLSLLPSNRKRLCLEKVPGSRGGQTRLSFA